MSWEDDLDRTWSQTTGAATREETAPERGDAGAAVDDDDR